MLLKFNDPRYLVSWPVYLQSSLNLGGTATMKAILILGALLFFWKLFGKKLLSFFLLRGVSRAALSKIGEAAVSGQPDSVSLHRLSSEPWKDNTVPTMISELKMIGFMDAGTYSVNPMPGVKVCLMVSSKDSAVANLFEHPKASPWIEFVTRYQDGTNATLATSPSTGLARPSWLTTMRAPKGSARDLAQTFLSDRPFKAMKTVTLDNAVQGFEEGYARYMSWRKETKVKPEEVAPTVKRWAYEREAELVSR